VADEPKAVTVHTLLKMKEQGERSVVLTCYDALFARLHAIEAERGRVRGERWGPRTLDLDIVRFGDRAVREPELTIPHPELPRRDFWLREIAELDGTPTSPTSTTSTTSTASPNG